MLSSRTIGLIFSALLLAASDAEARTRWLEHNGRSVMAPRRFGQENPAAIAKISAACDGGICGSLAGGAISTLLGASPECAQQDAADNMITVAKGLPDAGQTAALIAAAVEFRQAEKNVAPGFNTNPPTLRNSVFCQKAPVNAELNGLVQAQDPANDPNLFFDPADGKQIAKGDRPNTAPFGGAAANNAAAAAPAAAPAANSAVNNGNGQNANNGANANDAAAATGGNGNCNANANGNNNNNQNNNGNGAAAADGATANANGNANANANGAAAAAGGADVAAAAAGGAGGGSFGTCGSADVQFAGGLNNRKATEFTFLPVNQADFGQQGEALNPQIIFNFICDTFRNRCGGSAQQVTDCKSFATGIAGRDQATADAWNSGIGALAF